MSSAPLLESTNKGDVLPIPRKFGSYQTLETIGIGGYAVVVRVRNVSTGELYAAKVMRRPEANTEDMRLMERELRLCETVSCAYLVRCVEVVYREDVIIIVLEHSDGKDLLAMVVDNPEQVGRNWKNIFRQICLGVKYLHDRGLAHRDLKPDNILVSNDMDIKLCDYGLLCESRSSGISTTKCGTLPYMAPEMVHQSSYCGESADIWALGVILYVMVTGCIPWESTNDFALAQEIARGVTDVDSLSIEQKEVILRCCDVNPETRPKIDDILSLAVICTRGGIRDAKSMNLDAFKMRMCGQSMPGPILMRPSVLMKPGIRPCGSVLKQSNGSKGLPPRGVLRMPQCSRLPGTMSILRSK